MMKNRWLRRAFTSGSVLVTALIYLPATASAHHQQWTPLPLTYTLGQKNSIPCSGQLAGSVLTPHDRPGVAIVSLSWSTFFTSPCAITAFVNYSNTDTHQGGTRAIDLTYILDGFAAPHGTRSGQITLDIGSGNAGLTITTDALNSTYIDPGRFTTRFVVA